MDGERTTQTIGWPLPEGSGSPSAKGTWAVAAVRKYYHHDCSSWCEGLDVTSRDEEWESLITPPTAEGCYKFRVRRGVYLTGEVISGYPKPCDGWKHRSCAEKKAHRLLVRLSEAVADYERL